MRFHRVHLFRFLFSVVFLAAFSSSAIARSRISMSAPGDRLIVTPRDGHAPFLEAIAAAQREIEMVMFHLSAPPVAEALTAASARGVKVRVLLDRGIAGKSKGGAAVIELLKAGGVHVQLSSPAFSITHEKSMLVDGAKLFITTMNLTKMFSQFRDFGLITSDRQAVLEYRRFFEADWANAQTGAGETPANQTRLVWSPNSATQQLTDFIASARKTIDIQVENLGSDEITRALVRAVKIGVKVRLLVPACVLGETPNRNEPYLDQLAQGGIQVKVMDLPSSAKNPYIHAKAIVVDGQSFYVGSENFSFNSLTKAREVGILTDDTKLANEILSFIKRDFRAGKTRKIGQVWTCPAWGT